MADYSFDMRIKGAIVPVQCEWHEGGYAVDLRSPNSDPHKLFDNFKGLSYKVRRKNHLGEENRHDARMCASRVLGNGNVDFRIEFSDVHVSLYDIAKACAYVSQTYNDGMPVDIADEDVAGYVLTFVGQEDV